MNLRFLLIVSTVLVLIAIDPQESFAKKKLKKTKGNTIENFLRPPRFTSASLSPDGKHVAGLAPINRIDGEWGLVVINLDSMKLVKSFSWQKDHNIDNYNWVSNDRIVFSVSKWDSFASGIYGLNIYEKGSNPLIGEDAAVIMLDPNTDNEKEAWIWIREAWDMKACLAKINKAGKAIHREIAESDVYATKDNPLITNRIIEPPSQVYSWIIDNDHVPRIVLRFHQGKLEYLHREDGDNDWTSLPLSPEEWSIHVFSEDNRKAYVSGYNGDNTKGLYLYDIDNNTIGQKLFQDDYYDFSDSSRFLMHKRNLLGIRYQRDVPKVVWILPEMQRVQNMVDGALPGKVNIIDDWSDDFSRFLVTSYSDTYPPEYILLDLRTKNLKEITKSYPWLEYDKLSKTEVFHFNTDDGLRLESYITRPTTGEAPYPTICLVHGGPWTRDFAGFDEEAQFFASKGYAVLKINYRGSTGYGKRVSEDFAFDFREMHNDITTGVKAAIKAGIADPERLAIMGASFGGYAAMCGATFEEDFYQCAITNMGVFDWEEIIKDRKRQESKYSYHRLREEFGTEKTNRELFEDISPIYHIDKIQIPVFVIHGKKDKNVSIRQSKKLVSELKAHSVVFDAHFVSGEGHNIFDVVNRVETYEKVIVFLDKHMN